MLPQELSHCQGLFRKSLKAKRLGQRVQYPRRAEVAHVGIETLHQLTLDPQRFKDAKGMARPCSPQVRRPGSLRRVEGAPLALADYAVAAPLGEMYSAGACGMAIQQMM
jgi:hypothetical protein